MCGLILRWGRVGNSWGWRGNSGWSRERQEGKEGWLVDEVELEVALD